MPEIVAIGPHPDDVEIGMGGAVALFREKGLSVQIVDLTDGEPTPLGSPEIRAAESAEAARILGAVPRITLDMPNRFLADTSEARVKVAEILRELRPRILFIPYWEDAHPDHVAACALCEAARFAAKYTRTAWRGEPWYVPRVIHYFCSHLKVLVSPTFVLDVTGHIEKKMRALDAYESQFSERRGNLALLDDIRARARFWGESIGRPYGEPFVMRELLGLTDLGGLVFPG